MSGRRIAMWSCPRNISTAMLRAWENRPDTVVVDEPLYAHYLMMTKKPHPLAGQIIAHQETNWRKVTEWLTGPVPGGKAIFFQKHMTHHVLPHLLSTESGWLDRLDHWFLIRDPREMLTSYLHKMPGATMADLGFPQQLEIFRRVREQTGRTPPVVDSRDVLQDPRGTLGLLCEKLDVPFSDAMLNWPPGKRQSDGIWASHWYGQVEKTTTFGPYRAKTDEVPREYAELHRQCQEHYQELAAVRLRA